MLRGCQTRIAADCYPLNIKTTDKDIEMPTNPSIVLVHGFWGGAAHWAKVIFSCEDGIRFVSAVENPLTSLADDAERTRKMIAQQKGPVLLVGHSYGGAVITAAGNQPNVVGLSISRLCSGRRRKPARRRAALSSTSGRRQCGAGQRRLCLDQSAKFGESFCQDLPPDEALVMAVTQKAPVGSTFADKITTPAWKNKPSWYQISSEDRMIAPANEKRMAERMGAKKIITLSASHASLASRPVEVSALINEAAKAAAA